MININKYKNYRKIQNGGSDDTIIFDNDSINMKELNIDDDFDKFYQDIITRFFKM